MPLCRFLIVDILKTRFVFWLGGAVMNIRTVCCGWLVGWLVGWLFLYLSD